jgi:hypothetical protein
MIAPSRRSRRTYADRLRLAMELLEDRSFDTLLTGTSTLDELPGVLARLARPADGDRTTLCHSIDYSDIPDIDQEDV